MTGAASGGANTGGLQDWQARLQGPGPMRLGLDGVRPVVQRLGLDTGGSRLVVVAGSNGKGSCVAALEALLRRAGHSVLAYTSPHLLRVNERIRVDGDDIDDAQLCALFEGVAAAEQPGEDLSPFEFLTLAALRLVQLRQPDFAILEVGLGGRLDAVNLVDAHLAIITSIALEHCQYLGDTEAAIAREKAAVARRGRPAICGCAHPALLARLDEIGAQCLALGRDFAAPEVQSPLPLPSLACALQAALRLGVAVPDAPDCLAAVRLAGRMQKCTLGGLPLVLDVAHNPAAATFLQQQLVAQGCSPPVAVLGMMEDKDAGGFVAGLMPLVRRFIPVAMADGRAASTRSLCRAVEGAGAEVVATADDVLAGVALAGGRFGTMGPTLVTGSFRLLPPLMTGL